MPPEPSLIHVVPAPGMKESVEERLAPPGTLTYAQNCRFDKSGRVRKRGGAVQRGALGGIAATSGGSWLSGELVCVDSEVRRYQPSPVDGWTKLANDSPLAPVARYPAQLDEVHGVAGATAAVIGGVIVVASTAQTGFTFSTITGMNADGSTIWQARISGVSPRLLVYGGTLWCFFLPAAGGDLQYVTVTAAGLVSSPATLFSTGANVTCFDVNTLDGGNGYVVAVWDGTNVTVKNMNGASVLTSIPIVASGAIIGVAVGGSSATGDTIWVAWNNQTDVKCESLHPDLSGSYAIATVFAGGVNGLPFGQPTLQRVDATHAIVAVSRYGSASASVTNFGTHLVLMSQAGTLTRAYDAWGWAVASKFFSAAPGANYQPTTASRARLWVVSNLLGVDFGSRHAVLDVSTDGSASNLDGSVIALSYEREGGTNVGDLTLPPVVLAPIGTEQRQVLVTALPWNARKSLQGADVVLCALRPSTGVDPRASARELVRVGGVDYIGGGATLLEAQAPPPGANNFHVFPTNGIPLLPACGGIAVAGGSLTADQSYTYWPVYEHLDAAGQRVRAVGSPIAIATTGVNKQITLDVTVPGGTERPNMTCHLYRSWLGGPPHRVTPDQGAPAVTDAGGQGQSAGFVTFTDNMTDAVAATKEELLIGVPGAALPPAPPSGARLIAQGDGRVFVGSWDRRIVWVSKLWVPGEPVQFVDDDAFRIFFPEDLTALAYQDGSLIAFAERSVWSVTGDGPTDQGLNPYPDPRAVPVDSGAVGPWVVTASAGTFFESIAGIMLLPRGFGPPLYVGADVRDTLSAATPLGTGLTARIYGATKSETPSGHELVHLLISKGVLTYDVRAAAWSLDVFILGERTPEAIGMIANRLGMVQGVEAFAVTWIPEDGARWADARGTDNTDFFPQMKLTFAELRPFGICGTGYFERAVFALEFDAADDKCFFVVTSTLDDGFDSESQPEIRNFLLGNNEIGTGITATGRTGLLYLGTEFSQRKGSALTIAISDSQSSDDDGASSGSFDFFGFTMQVLPESGVRELPQAMGA
jgi:hypothetical protein